MTIPPGVAGPELIDKAMMHGLGMRPTRRKLHALIPAFLKMRAIRVHRVRPEFEILKLF